LREAKRAPISGAPEMTELEAGEVWMESGYLPAASRRRRERPAALDAHFDPEHCARRQVLLRQGDPRIRRAHLERAAGAHHARMIATMPPRTRAAPLAQADDDEVVDELQVVGADDLVLLDRPLQAHPVAVVAGIA
jgi:hypothetical protein